MCVPTPSPRGSRIGRFNSQLKRNNLETALSLAAWLKDYQLAL